MKSPDAHIHYDVEGASSCVKAAGVSRTRAGYAPRLHDDLSELERARGMIDLRRSQISVNSVAPKYQ
jgi:hypothetical protein